MPRILLIGCGRWGKLILRDLKSLDCVVDVIASSEQSISNAKEFGADNIVSGMGEIKHDLDGAVVAVPSIDHYKVTLSVIDNFGNIPIFVEKPLCLSSKEVQLLDEYHSDHVFVMHKWRYHTGILTLRDLARKNEFGNLKGMKLVRNGWGNPHKDIDCTWVLLPHDLSIVLEVLGYIPPAISALVDKTEERVSGIFGMLRSDEHWVSLEVSDRDTNYRREIILYFENGIAKLSGGYDKEIELINTENSSMDGKPEIKKIEFEFVMPLMEELRSFVGYVINNVDPPKSSTSESLKIVSAIEKLREKSNL